MPAYPYLPPPAPAKRKPRRWLIALVSAWAVVVAAVAVWSIRHDPPSVSDQRDIKQALPYLENATAAMLTAADGPGQVVVLGELTFTSGCRITPVRSGVAAGRTVTVHIRADQAPDAFIKIAQGLPASFKAQAKHNTLNTRQDLYADAGGYVAIEATAQSDDTVLSLRADTGCRPTAAGVDLDPVDTPAATPPAAFDRAMRLLRAAPSAAGGPVQRSVSCPTGGSARTVIGGDVPEFAGFTEALEDSRSPTAIVQAEPHAWAYRDGDASVVVNGSDGLVRVTATTGCA
jgi:hypothetical protein